MSTQTFGIVGQQNVLVTMFSTVAEDVTYSHNDRGEVLPPKVRERRQRLAMGRRLAKQGGEEVSLFPVT